MKEKEKDYLIEGLSEVPEKEYLDFAANLPDGARGYWVTICFPEKYLTEDASGRVIAVRTYTFDGPGPYNGRREVYMLRKEAHLSSEARQNATVTLCEFLEKVAANPNERAYDIKVTSGAILYKGSIKYLRLHLRDRYRDIADRPVRWWIHSKREPWRLDVALDSTRPVDNEIIDGLFVDIGLPRPSRYPEERP